MPNPGLLRADIYKAGHLAARLTQHSDYSVHFAYLPGYTGEPLAWSLPLGIERVTPQSTLPNFFTNLLPAGYRLNALATCLKTSKSNELGLLLALGADVPGDIQVVPAGEVPLEVPAVLVTDAESVSFHDLMGVVDRKSLPGVQAKLSARVSALMRTLPVNWNSEEALLKISPDRIPHLVENEFEHLRAAHNLKIPVAQSVLVSDREGVPGILVSRFDRGPSGERYALEDAAQILDIPPVAKYSADGDVTSESLLTAVSECAASPALAARNIYVQFLYAWLTGNGDVHAKNISLLKTPEKGWHVSPMYDVPNSWVYFKDDMALSVNSRVKNLKKRDWDALAHCAGIPEKMQRSLHKTALKAAAGVLWDRLPFTGSQRYGVERELSHRRWELEKYL